MDHLPITLIVKAPNQQIEDQTIKCELSWTINKLKQHLSEVYPSKPPKHEQKLIYSGQLLNDSVTLKDILRHYDGQEIHTVHLVCTPRPTNVKSSTANSTKPVQEAQMTAAVQQQATAPQNNDPDSPNLPQWTNNVGQMDPNQYAMQMAWMQQTYMQYMMQYMQLAANSYGQPQGVATGGAQPEMPQGAPNGQNGEPQQPQQQGAAAAVRDPDNLQERDWLDIFYMLSRMMILFTVVYFYSSPLRFVFVLLLAVAFYFYHIGFFRLNNANNINNNNNHVTADRPAAAAAAPLQDQTPSRLMVVWTFFATFFASLIPEIPNAV